MDGRGDGIRGRVITHRGPLAVSSRLVGLHNVENLLCAVGVGEALSLPLAAVTAGIEQMPKFEGRTMVMVLAPK